ncbi:MAG: dockerin type I domain-containing protein, partial [Candidatus Binatia bacterium]
MKFHKAFLALSLTALAIVGTATTSPAACGDYNADGAVTASDALGVLRIAVGTGDCAKALCDVDDNGTISASDALKVLKRAVGQSVDMVCPGIAVNDIAELPRATSQVVDGNSGSALVFGLTVPGAAVVADNSQGIPLGQVDRDTFGPDSSMAACEIANMTRIAMNAAAEADKILCYIQNAFTGVENQGVDIYDGNYHVFDLDFGSPSPGDGPGPEYDGGPSSVKMKMVRTGETITGFEMFTCEETFDGRRQGEYINQSIDSTTFSMVAKGVRSDPNRSSDSHQVQVQGNLNDFGQFVGTKTITLSHNSNWGVDTGYGEMVVSQSADRVDLDGYDAGSYGEGDWARSYAHRVTAAVELFDTNVVGETYQISLLALGDGAAKVSMRDGTLYSWSDFTEVQGWNGETKQVDYDAAADFVSEVLDAELVEVADSVAIQFEEGQGWDCVDTAEAVVTIDQLALDMACAHLDLGYDWINCFELIQGIGGRPGGPGVPCDGPGCEGGCDPNDPACDPGYCDPAVDPYCDPGYCDPAVDPNCDPGYCDPMVDPYCDPGYCDPAV